MYIFGFLTAFDFHEQAAMNHCNQVFLWHLFLLFLNKHLGVELLGLWEVHVELYGNYQSVFQGHRLKYKN